MGEYYGRSSEAEKVSDLAAKRRAEDVKVAPFGKRITESPPEPLIKDTQKSQWTHHIDLGGEKAFTTKLGQPSA